MFNLEEELKKLPGKPGVYLMHDKTDEIIYVGKAISLKTVSYTHLISNISTIRPSGESPESFMPFFSKSSR